MCGRKKFQEVEWWEGGRSPGNKDDKGEDLTRGWKKANDTSYLNEKRKTNTKSPMKEPYHPGVSTGTGLGGLSTYTMDRTVFPETSRRIPFLELYPSTRTYWTHSG